MYICRSLLRKIAVETTNIYMVWDLFPGLSTAGNMCKDDL